MTPHKLIRHGVKEKLWGECSCGMWCWLGTYHMPKGRLATLRAEHASHLAIIARSDTCPDCGFTFETCRERGGTDRQCYRWDAGLHMESMSELDQERAHIERTFPPGQEALI